MRACLNDGCAFMVVLDRALIGLHQLSAHAQAHIWRIKCHVCPLQHIGCLIEERRKAPQFSTKPQHCTWASTPSESKLDLLGLVQVLTHDLSTLSMQGERHQQGRLLLSRSIPRTPSALCEPLSCMPS